MGERPLARVGWLSMPSGYTAGTGVTGPPSERGVDRLNRSLSSGSAISPKMRAVETPGSPIRQRRMEPLWSPAVATGGNRWQMWNAPETWLRQPKTVAVGRDRLPEALHGKEGVDGSSPSEGSAKAPHNRSFCFGSICRFSNMGQVWSPLWSLQVENALLESRVVRRRAAQRHARGFIARAR